MSNVGECVRPIGGYRKSDDFTKLKCSRCKKYLSVGPIRTNSDGRVVICGRCSEGDLQAFGEFYRNVLYESIAKFLLFPSNSGCFCKAVWNSKTIHDQDCPERRIDCFDPGCPAVVKFKEMLEHFQHMHRVYNGYTLVFYLGVLNSGIRLIAFDAYMFIFSYVVHPCTIWFSMFNVNYENKQTLRFRLTTLDWPMHPNVVNNRYRIRLWSEIDNMLHIDHMYHIVSSAPRKTGHFYVVQVIIEDIGIEDAPICPDCSRKMVEENCQMCPKGHAFCLDCYQEAEFCPECTNMKTKSLRRNWILDDEDDTANSDW